MDTVLVRYPIISFYFSCSVPMHMAVLHAQRMQEHLLITDSTRLRFALETLQSNASQRYKAIILTIGIYDNCIFTALCFVDGGRIGMRDIVNLFSPLYSTRTPSKSAVMQFFYARCHRGSYR